MRQLYSPFPVSYTHLDQALLIEGFSIEDPIAYSRKICELLVDSHK